MTEKIKTTLRDSSKARWTAMIIVSITMFGAYFFNYAMSPVKPMLETLVGWNSADFGIYTSSYSWFNVFLFMLIFSGIILDKLGIRFTGVTATLLMAIGTGLNYWALVTTFPAGATIFGIKSQVLLSAIGFGIFGVGTEAAGITVSKAIVKWFKGHEIALAMGLQMSIARLGTALALGIALPVADKFGYASPVLLAFVFMLIGFTSFIIYTFMDKKLDKSNAESTTENKEEDNFELKDILTIIKNKGFWYIAMLCVLFYSAVFPFLFYATDLMINKYSVNPSLAGTIPALLPFGTIFLTPLFGTLYDRKGKGASIMMLGSVILIFVHAMLTIPGLNSWILAAAMVIILGIAFSLVPAAMWPSVPKIIPEKQLGTAYAVIFWIQNIGLWAIPLLLGLVLNLTNATVIPNKTMMKDAFTNAYVKVLKDNEIEFKGIKINEPVKKKLIIGKIAANNCNNVIKHILLDTSYQPTNEKIDKITKNKISEEIQSAIYTKLKKYKLSGDNLEIEKTLRKPMIEAIGPIIKKNKLNIRYNYFYDLLLFLTLSLLSLLFAFLLKKEDKKKGYGLEQPNIS